MTSFPECYVGGGIDVQIINAQNWGRQKAIAVTSVRIT